ncbi:hypothetical protein AB1Y20_013619 [Prymnesium parvum]|uniref:Uncharacterized protein n=1 Tax=Prymnesium parvum TaxID=97485 RepID=A0AB34IIS7_PRYPA
MGPRAGISPFRWHQLHAECTAELAAAPRARDVVWSDLAALCDPRRPSPCNSTLVHIANSRPLVSTVDARGRISSLLYPGSLLADGWPSAASPPSPPGSPAAATDLLRHAAVVSVRDASLTAAGDVLARGRRYGGAARRACGLDLPRLPPPSLGCRGPLTHALLLSQRWIDSFSHIFFHLLPQLALLLDHAPHAGAPPVVLLGPPQRYSSPALEPLLAAAFGLDARRLRRSPRGEAHFASLASLLYLPPGACAHTATYGRASLAAAHVRLAAAAAASTPRHGVVYFRRPCPMRRCVANEPALLRALRAALAPPFALRVVDTGREHAQPDVGGAERAEAAAAGAAPAAGQSFRELRHTLAHARAVLSVCGSAWGNAVFAPVQEATTSLVEINWLHGRAAFVNLQHYLGGRARYWVLEPAGGGAADYSAPITAPIAQIVVALRAAGVARCVPPARDARLGEDDPPLLCNMSRIRDAIG